MLLIIKAVFPCFLLTAIAVRAQIPQHRQTPYPDPQDTYGPLYQAVEINRVFPDSKTFADATGLVEPQQILTAFKKEKDSAGFSLNAFVPKYFLVPGRYTSAFSTHAGVSIGEHIRNLWPLLTHMPTPPVLGRQGAIPGSLIPLPKAYIVPGGRFREIYYWDTYFTCLGLVEDKKIDLLQDIVDNFAFLVDDVGHIPNGNRSYYLGRSQPPFFPLMVALLASQKGNQVYVRYLPELVKEYRYWMEGIKDLANSDGKGFRASKHVVRLGQDLYLNRYYDERTTPRSESYREDYLAVHHTLNDSLSWPEAYRNIRAAAESGWDFSTRWFNGQNDIARLNTLDLIPVDLNCLLYKMEQVIATGYTIKGDRSESRGYTALAQKRKQTILKYCWGKEIGFFLDYNFKTRKPSLVESLAGMYPLFFQIATPIMAKKASQVLEQSFLKPGGFVSTLTNSGQQWDAPNGWAPLQWMTIKGLERYGNKALALRSANRWLHLNEKVFYATGKMQEKYNVSDTTLVGGGGEYPNQDGFGWTNGVYQKLRAEYLAPVRK